MRFSDVKVGYIYNVIFDPVRNCEFNGKHLAVVLKKNNDKATFIVMPLTSAPNGVGINKYKIGSVKSLPTSLQTNETYAVFNQIRTVNADRFISLKEGSVIKQCKMETKVFNELLCLGIQELIYSINQENKIIILKQCYEEVLTNKAKDLAYQVIKLRKNNVLDIEQINNLLNSIKTTINGLSYSLDQKSIKDGVESIFDEALKLSNYFLVFS